MKHSLIFTLSILCSLSAFCQVNNIVFTAGVAYTDGVPTFNPGGKGSRIAVDLTTKKIYTHTVGTTWALYGNTLQVTTGCVPPAYVPVGFQSDFVINACDSLYMYRGGEWRHLNGGGGGISTVSTDATLDGDGSGGDPLKIAQQSATSGQVLKWNSTTWMPANDNNTTYTGGTGISISGGNVISNTLPADNLGNHTATTTLNLASNNVTNPGTISKTTAASIASISWDASNYLKLKNINIAGTNSFDMSLRPNGETSTITLPGVTMTEVLSGQGFFLDGYDGSYSQVNFEASFNGVAILGRDATGNNTSLFSATPATGLKLSHNLLGIGRTLFETVETGSGEPYFFLATQGSTGSDKRLTMQGDTITVMIGERDNTYFGIGEQEITIGNTATGKNEVKYDNRDPHNYLRYTVDKSTDLWNDTMGIPIVKMLNQIKRPYRVYTAIITQTGTDDPVANVLENTFGGAISWTRLGSKGEYQGALTGAFIDLKTAPSTYINMVGGVAKLTRIYRNDDDTINIRTTDLAGSYEDDILDGSFTIEIRVYN